MQLPADRYAVVDGLRLRYWLEGDAGPNLVLIHGIGGSVDVWRKQFDTLPRTHRVLALDLPGCGRSGIPPTFPPDTLHLLAGAVRGLMRHVGMTSATIIGSSLGGAVTLEFAMRWPELATSLVLVGPAGTTPNVAWALRLMTLPGLGEVLTRPDRTRTAHAIRQCVADSAAVTEADIDRAYVMANLPGARDAFLRLLRTYASVRGIDPRELQRVQTGMRTIHAPSLVIWGAQDRILPVTAAALALTHLPNAALTIRARSGHLVFVEEPTWFDQVVSEFVAAPDDVLTRMITPTAGAIAPRDAWFAHMRAIAPQFSLARPASRRLATAATGLALLLIAQYAWQRRG